LRGKLPMDLTAVLERFDIGGDGDQTRIGRGYSHLTGSGVDARAHRVACVAPPAALSRTPQQFQCQIVVATGSRIGSEADERGYAGKIDDRQRLADFAYPGKTRPQMRMRLIWRRLTQQALHRLRLAHVGREPRRAQ
jgi:hypothetical protein